MKHLRSLTATAATFALALSAQAHPGHALGDHGALHAVTSPYHLSILAAGGAVLWFAARFVQRQLPRRVLQIAGVSALCAAAVLWGVRA